jgi:hypothetical protein
MTCCIELEVKHKDEHFAKKKQQLILETVTEKGNPSGMYRKLCVDCIHLIFMLEIKTNILTHR